jgi:hypothetical protein
MKCSSNICLITAIMFIVSSHSGKASGKRDQANKKGLELFVVPTHGLCYNSQAIGLINQPKV